MIAMGLSWVGWVSSELNTIKNALVSKTQTIDSVSVQLALLQRQVAEIDKRGSEPVQVLQHSIDKLSSDLEKHILTTSKLMGKKGDE